MRTETRYIRPHYIKENKTITIPSDHLFIDIESSLVPVNGKVTLHTLQMGWGCYWRRRPDATSDTLDYRFFTTVPELVDMMESCCRPKCPLLLISHNLSYEFGVMGLFQHLHDSGWETVSFYSQGMTSIINFRKGELRIKGLDNGNIFPGKLATLGDAVGLPKLNVNFERDSWEYIKTYCKRDVEIMVKARQQYYAFIVEHDLGGVALTVPSQAWRAWRHRFMSHKVLIHGNPVAAKVERASYRGGRCSVFYQGERHDQTYTKVDVNSMYPYVMAEHDYPTILKTVDRHCTLEKLIDYLSEYCVVAQVEIEAAEPVYPIQVNGRNVYPVGRFWATLSTPELMYALDNAELLDVQTAVVYERAPIFRDYVNYLYPLKVRYKAEGNKPYYKITKLLQNGLYGRLAMLGHQWTKEEDLSDVMANVDEYHSVTTGETTTYYHFGNETWSSLATGETTNSFAAIPAHVTAYARLHLWALCQKAGVGHYLYCDTDSLIVDELGLLALADEMDPDRLGALKVEEASDTLFIGAPKFYKLGDDWKRKGVSEKAVVLDPQTFQQDRFPSFLSQGRWPKYEPYTTESIIKHFNLKIYDGSVKPDGWVLPLQADELYDPLIGIPELSLPQIETKAQLETLDEMRILPPTIMGQLWNYGSGDFKQARNGSGDLVALEYSKWDGLAADYGLPDVDALKEEVIIQIARDRERHSLAYQLNLLNQ